MRWYPGVGRSRRHRPRGRAAARADREPAVPAAPPASRLVLRDVLELPAAEVAVMLGSTTASVKSALQRVRARLEEVSPAADQIAEPGWPEARALLDQYIAAFENATPRRGAAAGPRCGPGGDPAAHLVRRARTCVPFLRDHVLGTPASGACCSHRQRAAPRGDLQPGPDGEPQPYGIYVLTGPARASAGSRPSATPA